MSRRINARGRAEDHQAGRVQLAARLGAGRKVRAHRASSRWLGRRRARGVRQLTEGEIVVQDARAVLAWDSVRNLNNQQIPALVTLADGTVREIAAARPTCVHRSLPPTAAYIVYSTAVRRRRRTTTARAPTTASSE